MIEGYKKLLNDLEMHKRFKTAFTSEYEYNQGLLNKNTEMNTKSTLSNKPIDRILEDLKYYGNLVYIENENIVRLEGQIKAIDECINQSDVTIKVARLRALGMSQEAVAELVDRCPRQVQRIEKELKM